MTNNDSSSFMELFSEVLDKLIETQIQSTRVASDLKHAVENNQDQLKELTRVMAEINAHFSNGFRHEISGHLDTISESINENIRDSMEKMISETKSRSDKLERKSEELHIILMDFTNTLKNPKSWIAAFIFVGTLCGLIAGLIKYINP